MLTELRYALRSLRHNAGFAATAILSIGLGIGANSAIFSLGDGLVLRPLPVPNASEIVSLRSRAPSGRFLSVSYRDYQDFRDQSRSFESLVAYSLTGVGLAPDPGGEAGLAERELEQVRTWIVVFNVKHNALVKMSPRQKVPAPRFILRQQINPESTP